MRNIWTSAAYRIAFTYSTAFALTIVLLGIAIYFAADAKFREQLDARITQETVNLLQDFRSDGLDELRASIAAHEVGNATNSFGYALFDTHGARIAGSLRTPPAPPGWRNIEFYDPQEGADPARALSTSLPNGFRLVVAADAEPLERFDRTILWLFAGAFVLVAGIGVIGALLLGVYLRRRLDRISGTAHAIMSGNIDERVAVSLRNDEFDQLSLALNAMLDRIALLLENLRQVSSDVAHDLRTPLARLRNQLEDALSASNDQKALRTALERSIEQSDDMLALFAAILRISEIEAGALAQMFARFDLSTLIADISESYAPAVTDGGRTLAWRVEPDIAIRGDRELIAQALINLLDNAQRHTPPGTHIAVDLAMRNQSVELSVSDTGPGVAAKDRARITQRFTRLETSRTTPGHGLGLNLVSAVASAHGARMTISDNAPGLRVVLSFERQAA